MVSPFSWWMTAWWSRSVTLPISADYGQLITTSAEAVSGSGQRTRRASHLEC